MSIDGLSFECGNCRDDKPLLFYTVHQIIIVLFLVLINLVCCDMLLQREIICTNQSKIGTTTKKNMIKRIRIPFVGIHNLFDWNQIMRVWSIL